MQDPAHYAIRTKRYKLIYCYGLAIHSRMDEIWVYGPREEINEENLHQVSCLGTTKPASTPARLELFDLEKDPYEQQNVYNYPAYAKVVEDLKQQLLSLNREVGDLDNRYP